MICLASSGPKYSGNTNNYHKPTFVASQLQMNHKQPDMIKFVEKEHKYTSINPDDNIKWISVTSVIKQFEEEFNTEVQAEKCSKNKKSKWYGKSPEEIKTIWARVNHDSVELGNWYHKQREDQICGVESLDRSGETCKIVRPIVKDLEKFAPDQKLENNHLYPEHMVFLKSAGICGQSDLVEVRNNTLYITDYKTNKNLTTEGYTNWKGETKMLLYPLSHLEECKLNIYNIQLSLYMYIILKHNPQLKPGNLTIHHVIFKEIDRDSNNNPIYDRDFNNEPIVERVDIYEMKYLKDEVQAILNYLKTKK